MYGIDSHLLDGSWCNLVIAAEDIYYHEKVFRKCVEEYSDVICGLNKVIINLLDYTAFEHDDVSARRILWRQIMISISILTKFRFWRSFVSFAA